MELPCEACPFLDPLAELGLALAGAGKDVAERVAAAGGVSSSLVDAFR